MKKKYSFFIFLMMMAGMFTSCNSKIETNTSIAKTETDFQKDTTACDCSEIVSKRSSDGNPVKGEEHQGC